MSSDGTVSAAASGTAGTANTGGGGGGAGDGVYVGGGGAGGSGIVVARVPGCFALAGTPCCAYTAISSTIGKFTADGTLTISEA